MISVADFSKYPSGRDANDGSFNGQKFRQSVLLPAVNMALSNSQIVCVSLRDVMSFGSSFLEEAFGGLVSDENISKSDLKRLLRIDPGKPSFSRHERAIWKYIQDA